MDGVRCLRWLPPHRPQIHISNHKSGSFNPYPSTTPLAQQIAWGVTLLKFATVEDEGHWRGLTYWSPFVAEPEEDKTVGFYLKHPMRGAFLMLGHAYAGFHYDQITPYWRLDRARPLTIWLVLSSAIVFLGVVRMTAIVIARDLDADRAFAIATVAPVRGFAGVAGDGVPVRYRGIRDAVDSGRRMDRRPGRRVRGGRGSARGCSCTSPFRSCTTRCCCKVRISSFRSILLATSLSSAMLAADTGAPPRVPLHWLWNERETDSTYTVSAERREWLVRERGYADMDAIAYVDARPASRSRPLMCFYAAAPRTDTLCTISALEQRIVRSLGYEEIGVEGFMQSERVAGSIVLYRVSRAYGEGDKDREHRFVVSQDELVRLRKLGWTYDGSKGFVYPGP